MAELDKYIEIAQPEKLGLNIQDEIQLNEDFNKKFQKYITDTYEKCVVENIKIINDEIYVLACEAKPFRYFIKIIVTLDKKQDYCPPAADLIKNSLIIDEITQDCDFTRIPLS
jgi:hypothetical protein